MKTPKDLLEHYVLAKDRNRPLLILECHAADALLTYSIATDTISFPARVAGADAIAQTLVRDFRKNFDCCRTYYVCDALPGNARSIVCLPWPVIMRQIIEPGATHRSGLVPVAVRRRRGRDARIRDAHPHSTHGCHRGPRRRETR